jgi:hypothetical protein
MTGMEHQMLVRSALVEVASGLAALGLLVVAVVCGRRTEPLRRAFAVVCLAGCVTGGVVAAHSHHTLAGERARKCNSNVQRGLCDWGL